ncbi:type II toxin-antitoxin system RelE/ParE family toxin [Candidatus Bathyarchaeota archaeon]|nr:MAG: type II toxin-antitoxin system RelE/ParE family toxin [Candidatus Bathyarchaeota archaeon]
MGKAKYSLAVTKRFKKSFEKLPKDVQERVYEKLILLLENPHLGIRLRGELSGLYRLRVGDYRVIYAIDKEKRLIVLLDVGHRRRIY